MDKKVDTFVYGLIVGGYAVALFLRLTRNDAKITAKFLSDHADEIAAEAAYRKRNR